MVGIPMGTNCAPLLADLFLYSCENEFLDTLIKKGKRKLARKFNVSYRYIDELISFNNKRFKEFISDIYPKELTIFETTESTSAASYLDLLFIRDKSNNITTKLHRAFMTRLLLQGYKVNYLSITFKEFYGRHTDLIGQYKENVCQMFAGSIS